MYNHWFASRPKRKLTVVLNALVAFNDLCVGKKWEPALQLDYEDLLEERGLMQHGTLRARKAGIGGGGARTYMKQLKDLGLAFQEDDNKKCRLTLIGRDLVNGDISFVEAMRLQLQRYQYPSATTWSGSAKINHEFRVHPFQFMFRLLRDPRLKNTLSVEEMYGIVIHEAKSDSKDVFEKVVEDILKYRADICENFIEDTKFHTYYDISNTFFNYITMTQYIDRGYKTISIRKGKETDVDSFIDETPTFIPSPEITENYIRRYGRGLSTSDRRTFNTEKVSEDKITESRIRSEYVLLALKTPITEITSDIVETISNNTGIDETVVEKFLVQNFSKGNIDDFFLAYKELAYLGRSGASEFEKATCEMFRKIFHMKAVHVGPKGNTPDVFVESDSYCGIIDNKAYKNGYSITGNHKRVMEDEYIPKYKRYGNTEKPLAFFTYIAGSFGTNINSQLAAIIKDTNINGSAMPVDLFINFAQDYANKGYSHETVKNVFSVGRQVSISDLENATV